MIPSYDEFAVELTYNQINSYFSETFHMNPRLCLSLQESGDIVMALNQHTAMDPKVIGFTGYPLSPSGTLPFR